MRTLAGRILAVVWAGFLGFLIIVLGAGIWSALVAVNLSVSPAIPWAVPAMCVVLALMWIYMAGRGWPRSTSQARRLCLRAHLVSGPVFRWSMLAGTLSVAAFAGFWIVMSQLVKMPGNALPDFSHYPRFTVASILERHFNGPIAVGLSSTLFALAHGPTQGFLWPKLLFYFLVGVAFGSTAYLTKSILPAIPGHVFGLLIFFTLIWPHDAARTNVWQNGTDTWFWLHLAQTIVFAVAAVWAFRRLTKVCNDGVNARGRAI
jgi:hypothetical protein